jgi:hypothetical protein
MSYMGLYFLPDALDSIDDSPTDEPRRRWPVLLATALVAITVLVAVLFA